MSFAGRLEAIVSDASSTATEVWTDHEGEAVAAFSLRFLRETRKRARPDRMNPHFTTHTFGASG